MPRSPEVRALLAKLILQGRLEGLENEKWKWNECLVCGMPTRMLYACQVTQLGGMAIEIAEWSPSGKDCWFSAEGKKLHGANPRRKKFVLKPE